MNRILVPTDFSNEANNALDAAKMISKAFDADIILFHVIEGPSEQSFNVEGEIGVGGTIDDIFVAKLVPIIKNRFEKIVEENPGYKLGYDIKVGNTYNSIIDIVANKDCHLIVMGTQGVSGLSEVLVGSNTEKVVRTSKCPVLAVKSAIDDSTFKNIVFATDMGPHQASMVAELKDFQKAFDAKLHLVRINTPANFQSDQVTKQKMKEFASEHALENYTLNIFNDPIEGDGIMYFAEDIDAGTIALATHGRTGLSHLLSGSIAEELVNHAKRPVLTFNIR